MSALVLILLLQIASPDEGVGDRASAYREFLLARLAAFDNRTEAAAAHLARARKLDPRSAQIRSTSGVLPTPGRPVSSRWRAMGRG